MSIFWPLITLQFLRLKMIVFYLKYPKTIFSGIISVKNSDKRNLDFWTKFMALTSLKKMSSFWPLLKLKFSNLKMIVFFHKYRKTIFSDIISVKNSHKKNFDFWTKSMDLPLWKMSIFWPFLKL